MKKIEAIIKPFKIEEVKDALGEIGVEGMTVTEVKGLGVRKVIRRFIAAASIAWIFCPKLKIEMVVADPRASNAWMPWLSSAGPGKIGDGKIFVATIEHAVRIRTAETGELAI